MSEGFLSETDARAVLASGELSSWLRVRLVMIAGGNSHSAAVRAIEMLMSSGGDVDDDDYDDIPFDELLKYRDMVRARLSELQSEWETTRINENGSADRT